MDNFTPVSALAGGVLIGLASVWLLAANGRIAGVSGILHGIFAQPPGDRTWRVLFLTGLVAGGFAWHAAFGFPAQREISLGWVALAGLLVGFGTRVGSGCTSGHGVCGLGRFSLRSLVAVCVFMAMGVITAVVMRHVIGVAS